MKPRVTVIIVNWNGEAHLAECLGSLAAQTYRDFEVIVVDNGSEDGSLTLLREQYQWVRLLPLQANTGFAAGNNQGLALARGEYLVTLNNDTRVAADWLEILVAAADAHPAAGMVGCRICSYADPDLIDSIGMGICRDGMSRGRYRNRRWSSLSLPAIEEILFPSACAALYRRRMIEEIGFFDEEFFAYAEDSDLGLRGRLAGWDAVLATQAVVYHKYSQSSGRLSPFKVYLVERNHYWVVLKNFPFGRLCMVPVFTLSRYFEQLRLVLRGGGTGMEVRSEGAQRELLLASLKGICGAIAGVPRTLRRRSQVMATRRLSAGEFAKLLDRHRISFRELLDAA